MAGHAVLIEQGTFGSQVLRSIVRDVARENNRFSGIVLGIVKSAQFQMRAKAADSATNSRRALALTIRSGTIASIRAAVWFRPAPLRIAKPSAAR